MEIKQDTSNNRIEIDCGQRSVCSQNYSFIIVIPKIALKSCGNPTKFRIIFVQENNKKYLKMVPVDSVQVVEEFDPMGRPQRQRA